MWGREGLIRAGRVLVGQGGISSETEYLLYLREDHFEMKFMVKYCKLVKRLVKIGTFEFPNPNFGPTSPQVPALLPT